MSDKKRPVPKFTSFKPKVEEQPPPPASTTNTKESEKGTEGKEKRSRTEGEDGRHGRDRSRSRHRDGESGGGGGGGGDSRHGASRHGERRRDEDDERHRHRHRSRDRDRGRDREKRERDKDRDRHRRRDGDKYTDKDKKKERDRDRHRDRKGEGKNERNDQVARIRSRSPRRDLESQPLQLERVKPSSAVPGSDFAPPLYVIDTKGDRFFAQFGRHDRSQVPRYRRAGGGRVLGTNGRLIIHWDGSTPEAVLRFSGGGGGRDGRDVHALRRVRVDPNPTRVRAKMGQSGAPEEGFISFEKSRKRKREVFEVEDDQDGSSDDGDDGGGLSYRTIVGKGKNKPSDQESDEESEHDSSQEEQEDPNSLKQTSIRLSRAVRDRPSDVPAWLDLVAHQDRLLRAGEGPDRALDPEGADAALSAAAHSFAEIKLSMLESALKGAAREDRQGREKVLVAMMREGARVWGAEKTAKRWQAVLDENGDSFALWRAYVDYEMGKVDKFSVDGIKKLFVDRLEFLTKRIQQQHQQQTMGGISVAAVQLQEQTIYVFLRMTRFLFESGFTELAVAAWQAVLELNFLRPRTPMSRDQALGLFEDFWESEVLRIGEDGAQGWAEYVRQDGATEPPEPKADDDDDDDDDDITAKGSMDPSDDDDDDEYAKWFEQERRSALSCRMPSRTLDPDTDDDPYKVVLFSDIKPLLIFIEPSPILPAVAEQLVDAFLIFCNATPAVGTSHWTRLAQEDQFHSNSLRDVERKIVEPPADISLELDGERVERSQPGFTQEGLRMEVTPSTLFPGQCWFGCIPSTRTQDGKPNCLVVEPDFVLNTLGRLARETPHPGLGPYHLALEWRMRRREIGSVARESLATCPDTIELYTCYARAEHVNGNRQAADAIMTEALNFVPFLRTVRSESDAARLDSQKAENLELWTAWAWMRLENGDDEGGALARLCAGAHDKHPSAFVDAEPTPIQKLVAIKTLEARDAVGVEVLRRAEALMLLKYLTASGGAEPRSPAQGNITAAMESVHLSLIDIGMRPNDARRELLCQAAARLLYLHASRGPYRRDFIRTHMTNFATLCPHNDIFLSLLSWLDPSLPSTKDHFRTFVHDRLYNNPTIPSLSTSSSLSSADSVSLRAMAVRHELSHSSPSRAAAVLERALAADACSASAALWRCFVVLSSQREAERRRIETRSSSSKKALKRRMAGMVTATTTTTTKKSQAKDAFYRAVGKCPWSRELMMLAFGMLRADMDDAELRGVFDGLSKRGLRVHCDFDDFLDKRRGRNV